MKSETETNDRDSKVSLFYEQRTTLASVLHATAGKRIGAPYRFCQLINPHQWFPVALE